MTMNKVDAAKRTRAYRRVADRHAKNVALRTLNQQGWTDHKFSKREIGRGAARGLATCNCGMCNPPHPRWQRHLDKELHIQVREYHEGIWLDLIEDERAAIEVSYYHFQDDWEDFDKPMIEDNTTWDDSYDWNYDYDYEYDSYWPRQSRFPDYQQAELQVADDPDTKFNSDNWAA